FRRVPTFGRSTIRRFSRNVSGLKQMAGRDFEDILQCIIPVFDGLLPPPHDELVATLLFQLAYWHGLAKLRLHTDETVALLHAATRALGKITRKFLSKTCEAYDTRELPREEAARGRRKAAMMAKRGVKAKSKGTQKRAQKSSVGGAPAPAPQTGAKRKLLNLLTFKWHSLGHYASAIPWFGPLDGVNTQTVRSRRVTDVIYAADDNLPYDRVKWNIVG
ncbi:uncharacterized protein B0H18DRAFT_892726, partial [Fomitopsis serialis]|uniref:uncharacterized protein n=1 Tax=Fomitopsis serialis TaxID=139415 RepID=UPI0020087E32